MRAITWQGRHKVQVDTVPDPEIVNPRDAIIRITSTAICGSDLHLYDGYIPTMRAGDILGHENMGEVVEVGPKSTLTKGQRVVIPFTISCGQCFHCSKLQYSACDNANPATTSDMSETLYGYPMGAAFGYAHLTGGYAGGQAEYLRVPYSDVGPIVIPDGIEDDKVLFLSDILPTGWMAAENAEIEDGDTIAVWGCGPVGLFAIQSAFLMGAHRVIAIDHYPSRLALGEGDGRGGAGLSSDRHSRGAVRDDRRHRPGCLHRLRRDGEPRPGHRQPDRSRQGLDQARHGSAGRASPGDPRLPQGRPGLGSRGLWRHGRQIPDRRLHGEGADDEDGADPRPEVQPAAARAHPGRQARYRPS